MINETQSESYAHLSTSTKQRPMPRAHGNSKPRKNLAAILQDQKSESFPELDALLDQIKLKKIMPDWLVPGQYIDVLTKAEGWQAGLITNSTDAEIHVQLVGLAIFLRIARDSDCLAPFRSQSKPQQLNFVDSSLLGQLIDIKDRADLVAESQFKCFKTAQDCTQFVRGQLISAFNCIFVKRQWLSISNQSIEAFVRSFFSLIFTWLDIMIQDGEMKPSEANPLQFCTELKAAIAACGPDLAAIFASIWPISGATNASMALARIFQDMGGFQRIISKLAQSRELSSPYRLKVIANFIEHFKSLHLHLQMTQAMDFYHTVSQAFLNKLVALSKEELKALDLADLSFIARLTLDFEKLHNTDLDYPSYEESLIFCIAKQHLKGPVYERRIGAILILWQKASASVNNAMNSHVFERLVKLIKNDGILRYIFIEHPQAPLIKRALNLVKLCEASDQSALDQELIQGLWKCCTHREPDIRRAALALGLQFPDLATLNTLAAFFNEVISLDPQAAVEDHVRFLRDFIKKLFERLQKENLHKQFDENNQAGGLNLLSQIGFWTSSSETRKLAFEELRELMQNLPSELFMNCPTIEHMMDLAYNNLNAGECVLASLEFFSLMLIPSLTQTVMKLYTTDAFWRTLIYSVRDEDLKAARKLLLELYWNNQQQQDEWLNHFTSQMVGYIDAIGEQLPLNDRLVLQRNVLGTISEFIAIFEDDETQQTLELPTSDGEKTEVILCLMPEKDQKTVKVLPSMTFLQLIGLAAKEFKLRADQLCIVQEGQPIPNEFLLFSVEDFRISQIELYRKDSNSKSPKHTIAQHQQFVECLLKLTETKDEEIMVGVISLLKTLPANRALQERLILEKGSRRKSQMLSANFWSDYGSSAACYHKLLLLKDRLIEAPDSLWLPSWTPIFIQGLSRVCKEARQLKALDTQTLIVLIELIKYGSEFLSQAQIKTLILDLKGCINCAIKSILCYNCPEVQKVLRSSLDLLVYLLNYSDTQVEVIFEDEGLLRTFVLMWTQQELADIRKFWNSTFAQICRHMRVRGSQQPSIELFRFAIEQLMTTKGVAQAESILVFLNQLNAECEVLSPITNLLGQEDIEGITMTLVQNFQALHGAPQVSETALEQIYSLLAQVLVEFTGQNQVIVGSLRGLLSCIVASLLSTDPRVKPRLTTHKAREACICLVQKLIRVNPQWVTTFTEALSDAIQGEIIWPNNQGAIVLNRSETGFAGLTNLGNICYINSLLQQLYMIPPFRSLVLESQNDNPNILEALKSIFSELTLTSRQFCSPVKIIDVFRFADGSAIDVNMQQDIDEFFKPLLEQIEDLLKGTTLEAQMKNFFDGTLANEVICEECPHRSERVEIFKTIQLDIKGKRSIQESLQAYVANENLCDDNAYECSPCGLKRDAIRRQSIKRLPNVLCLMLKRFEIDYGSGQASKINDYCEFPLELDMSSYCQEALARNELLIMLSQSESLELTKEQKTLIECETTGKYFKYVLAGVVIHKGDMENGHYYSLARDREGGKWLCFNDQVVTPIDASHIADRAFGGKVTGQNKLRHEQGVRTFKHESAYLLIYERVQFIDQQRFERLLDPMKYEGDDYSRDSQIAFDQCVLPPAITRIENAIAEEIHRDNQNHWIQQYICNDFFIAQVIELYKLYWINREIAITHPEQRKEVEGAFLEFFTKVGLSSKNPETAAQCQSLILMQQQQVRS